MDSERDQVIRELTRHCGDGRLTLDELEERIEAAQAATTTAELDLLLRDLPAPRSVPAPPPPPSAAPKPMWPPVVRPSQSRGCAKPVHGNKVEGPAGVAICVAGFVLLFNGMFWLALCVWFLLPAMLKSTRRA